ncbi:hypothetical protein [Picrophilus oshimae]|uniref:Uncharacterized protein n=1 Tax=Picrophilus torridus (strain ATCC 700027 / DSM 9790 / JCM 10055 / NBRC 100828 / KAW 2/3) TaxID=1122961 RepID=Q6L2J0_PICTO|nr:hypothetical protein [Picrophilus oshimae]AAT42812.1 hypothetical protein PTO0227 [Picrophilus oshimae DSM 9789]SMD31573.1 hypothetical protein SAMN02745355_1525 [Picrophilus oshimae DSM 9789]
MPWVPIKGVEKSIYSMCMKLNDGYTVTLKSFKKDRIVSIKRCNDNFHINVDGFVKNDYNVNADDLKRILKDLINEEFPRSHQVMVSVHKD